MEVMLGNSAAGVGDVRRDVDLVRTRPPLAVPRLMGRSALDAAVKNTPGGLGEQALGHDDASWPRIGHVASIPEG
jgi:hypothetical protein